MAVLPDPERRLYRLGVRQLPRADTSVAALSASVSPALVSPALVSPAASYTAALWSTVIGGDVPGADFAQRHSSPTHALADDRHENRQGGGPSQV
jgi:hypothetical protein